MWKWFILMFLLLIGQKMSKLIIIFRYFHSALQLRVFLFWIKTLIVRFSEKLASMWLLFTIYFILVYISEEWVLISVELGYHWQQFLQKNMKKRGFLTSSAFLYSSCRCVPNEKLMCNTYLIFDLIIYSAKHSTLRWNVKKYLVPVA